jgi:hypothetical protein
MPIADVDLVMMALAAVLAAHHFPRKVSDLEGLLASTRTWSAWKVAFCLAHQKRQRQLQALGGGKPLSGAHLVTPAPASIIDHIGTALNNLALPLPFNSSRPPTWRSWLLLPYSRLPTRNLLKC